MKLKNPTDFWAGVMFMAIGLAFTLIAYGVRFGSTVLLQGYAMGTPARMGPGFFPFWLGILLTLLGLIIAIEGFKIAGRPVARFHWRPILFVLGAVILFGVLLKAAGMLLSGFLLVIVASLGSNEFRWKPVLILATVLVIFSALVFVYGLKLPIPLCPDVGTLQEMRICRV
jgi:hypothetical protein